MDTWAHIVARVPAGATVTGDVDVFINGIEASVTAFTAGGDTVTLNTNATDLHIGKWSGQNNTFDGQIDDVQFYDTALSDAQILQLFNNPGQAIPEPSTGMLLGLGGLAFFFRCLKRAATDPARFHG